MKTLTKRCGIVAVALFLFAGSAAAYPLGGTDTFPITEMQFDLVHPDGTVETLILSGPMDILRSDPYDAGGLQTIDTEILSMDLTGDSLILGPLILSQGVPGQTSLGETGENSLYSISRRCYAGCRPAWGIGPRF